MRSFLALFALTALLAPSLPAQEATKSPRFALSFGPAWTRYHSLRGVHVRGQYHLITDRWFGLQLEAAGLWTPTQIFTEPGFGYPDAFGWAQAVDFRVGAAATLTPLPRGKIGPYLLIGVTARQSWQSSVYAQAPAWYPRTGFPASSTHGEFVPTLGLGLRARIGGRLIQIELRQTDAVSELGLGSTLRF